MANVSDLLWRVFRDGYGVAGTYGKWRFVADPHEALTGLYDVPLENRQLMQLRGDAGLDARPRKGNLWLAVAVQELRDVTTLDRPHLFSWFRFPGHQGTIPRLPCRSTE